MDHPTVPEDLAELARLHGVEPEYRTEQGTPAQVPGRSLVAVLRALGVEAGTPDAVAAALEEYRERRTGRLLAECVVVREGSAATVEVDRAATLWIELEGGGVLDVPAAAGAGAAAGDGRTGAAPSDAGHGGSGHEGVGHEGEGREDLGRGEGVRGLPGGIPLGYHRLHVRLGNRTESAALIVCPERIAEPGKRLWGFAAQLYSALSERSWGMGDLSDLARLADWSGRTLGAGFVLVNPLHSMLPASFADHSPYWPSDRSFADPVHVRVEAVPEYERLDAGARAAVGQLAARAAVLRADVLDGGGLIDRDQVWDLKRRALEVIHRAGLDDARADAFRAFAAREGERLDAYATWCALAELHGPEWRTWPGELSDVGSVEVAHARKEHEAAVGFYQWLAWITDEQLADVQRVARAAGMPMGIIHDLAVGVHPSGAEAWALRRCIAPGITVGAPPDVFNAQGQDWHLPPWRPDALAAEGYAPYAAVLRRVLRHAGALRLDHVMGLFRLWWVPEGGPIGDGAYVRYDHEAMLAVLTLEAHRAGVPVIGEDLGTVEPDVRERLAARGIMGTSILWMERREDGHGGTSPRPAAQWRASCLVALTNHDLPSTASRLTGGYVELHHRQGMLAGPVERARSTAAAERKQWREALRVEGLYAAEDEDPAALAEALHRFMLRTPARLVCAWLPDGVGDLRSPNLPGVFDSYPNWQLPVADAQGRSVTLERLAESPEVTRLARLLNGDAGQGR